MRPLLRKVPGQRPSIRKAARSQPVAATAPALFRHRGVPYSLLEDSGVWRWKILPTDPALHAYEYSVPHGFRPTREAAEAAARTAIDIQVDA